MEPQPSPADVNELERRLADWRPTAAGLSADRLMFAAGRKSARSGRFAWPIVSVSLALVAVMLGVGFARERAQREELLAQLQRQNLPRVPARADVPPTEAPTPEPPSPFSYLASRQVISTGLEDRPVISSPDPLPETPTATQPVLKSHSSMAMIEP